MDEDHPPRLFANDAAIRHIGQGLLEASLDRGEWTHEAHLAACLWLIVERPDVAPERDVPDLIRRLNESVGVVNDATQGYHETITQCFIRGARSYLARQPDGLPLLQLVNGLLQTTEGSRDWPLRFYSKDRLFSAPARLGWAEPDLGVPLP